MDRNDPTYKNDPTHLSDGPVDPTTPGYTPVDGSGTALENEEHGNEAVGTGGGSGAGAGDQIEEEVAEGNTAPHDH